MEIVLPEMRYREECERAHLPDIPGSDKADGENHLGNGLNEKVITMTNNTKTRMTKKVMQESLEDCEVKYLALSMARNAVDDARYAIIQKMAEKGVSTQYGQEIRVTQSTKASIRPEAYKDQRLMHAVGKIWEEDPEFLMRMIFGTPGDIEAVAEKFGKAHPDEAYTWDELSGLYDVSTQDATYRTGERKGMKMYSISSSKVANDERTEKAIGMVKRFKM